MGTEETERQTLKLIHFKGHIRYRKIKQMENKKQKQKVKDTQIETLQVQETKETERETEENRETKTQIDTFYRKHKRQKGKTETDRQRRKLLTNKRRSCTNDRFYQVLQGHNNTTQHLQAN